MKQSVALIIINEEDDDIAREIVKVTKTSLYQMDVKVCVLLNSTTREIEKALEQLTKIKEFEVLDIICIIHAPVINKETKLFKTNDGSIHVYTQIMFPLFKVNAFEKINKIIITSGTGSDIELHPTDSPESTPYNNASNATIITSTEANFIKTFIPELVKSKGNIEDALESYKPPKGSKHKVQRETTAQTPQIGIPKITERPSTDEFSIY